MSLAVDVYRVDQVAKAHSTGTSGSTLPPPFFQVSFSGTATGSDTSDIAVGGSPRVSGGMQSYLAINEGVITALQECDLLLTADWRYSTLYDADPFRMTVTAGDGSLMVSDQWGGPDTDIYDLAEDPVLIAQLVPFPTEHDASDQWYGGKSGAKIVHMQAGQTVSLQVANGGSNDQGVSGTVSFVLLELLHVEEGGGSE